MKQEDLIKWALIAVGAYLVYQWLSQSSIFRQIPPGTGTGAGAGAGAGAGTGTGAGAGAGTGSGAGAGGAGGSTSQSNGGSTGGETVSPEDRDLQLMRAAWSANDAAAAGSTRMNAHQWNWYRARYAETHGIEFDQSIHSPQVDSVADPNLQYTASEYHAILNQLGLSGIGWGAPVFGSHRWSWMN